VGCGIMNYKLTLLHIATRMEWRFSGPGRCALTVLSLSCLVCVSNIIAALMFLEILLSGWERGGRRGGKGEAKGEWEIERQTERE